MTNFATVLGEAVADGPDTGGHSCEARGHSREAPRAGRESR